MKTRKELIKEEYMDMKKSFNTQLAEAIAKEDVVVVSNDGDQIGALHITKLHGVYGADEFDDYDPIKIKSLLQCTETGMMLGETDNGLLSIEDFDFVGSKKELMKLKLREVEEKLKNFKPAPNIRFI